MKVLSYRKERQLVIGEWKEMDIDPKTSLDAFQKLIGGYVERIPADELADTGISLYVDEEGATKHLPLSFSVLVNNVPVWLQGNAVFARDDDKDLTEAQIADIMNFFD